MNGTDHIQAGQRVNLYLAWRLLSPLTQVLPRPAAYAAADAIMGGVYHGWPQGRRAMRDNLRTVLRTTNQRRVDAWGQRQLRRYGEYLVDAARLHTLSAQDCYAALSTDGWPQAGAALREGPVLFVLMHMGNWDVLGGALAQAGFRVHVPVESLGHPALDRIIRRGREHLGMHPVPEARGLLSVRRALAQGEPAAVFMDRPRTSAQSGLDLRFCGRPCRLPDTAARLALAADARVIPIGCVRTSARALQFRALADFQFSFTRSGDTTIDAQTLTQGLLDTFAPWVRRHPDQWYQFRPFWQDAPHADGAARAR